MDYFSPIVILLGSILNMSASNYQNVILFATSVPNYQLPTFSSGPYIPTFSHFFVATFIFWWKKQFI